MLTISGNVTIPACELLMTAVRAQGPGGQNVNKVSSAIHLRFDIPNSSLPEVYKQRLLALNDSRINKAGVVIIKAQEYRTQEMNREAALARLSALINSAVTVQKKRRPTRPSKRAQGKRMDSKTRHGNTKKLRGKVGRED